MWRYDRKVSSLLCSVDAQFYVTDRFTVVVVGSFKRSSKNLPVPKELSIRLQSAMEKIWLGSSSVKLYENRVVGKWFYETEVIRLSQEGRL